MQYIKSETNPAIMKLMCQQLRDESVKNLDLYLPQICYLIITKPQDTNQLKNCVGYLKKLVLDISMKDTNIGIRSLLYFNSWKDDKEKSGKKAAYAKLAEEFSDNLQKSLVTKMRPEELLESVLTSDSQMPGVFKTPSENDQALAMMYIAHQIDYLNSFKQLSLDLKNAGENKT